MRNEAVFVIDGHSIDLYSDREGAAREIEGYDAQTLDCFGADGTVYEAILEGPEWGAVSLHPTELNRLDHLIRLLRSEAENRGFALASDVPDDPEALWGALLAVEQEQLAGRRSERRSWWRRRPSKNLRGD